MKHTVVTSVAAQSAELVGLSHSIHGWAETNFNEHRSSKAVADYLESKGFSLQRGIADLPTAFRASFGTGDLHIGICAEYDALAGVGHACGHNIIASAAAGAAVALREIADQVGLTVEVLGTPAEEGGGGKVFMLQRGGFDGLHAAMMVHPAAIERDAMATLAVGQLDLTFTGVAAHAASAPDRGVSAASAMTLAQVGIAHMREHLLSSDRVHGIITNGGEAPNVVPAHTSGKWFIRAKTIERMNELEKNVTNIFRGAALMTGCQLSVAKLAPSFSDMCTHPQMAAMWRANASELGRASEPINDGDALASTDMGNVSHAIPSIHPLIALDAGGATIHELAFANAAIGSTGDAAVVDGATLLAQTAIDIATNDALRAQLLSKPYRVADEDYQAPYLDNDWNQIPI